MSEMRERDSIELFTESMKKAASLAKQLAKSTGVKEWIATSSGLEALCSKGRTLYARPAPNRQNTLAMVDHIVEKTAIHSGNDKVH